MATFAMRVNVVFPSGTSEKFRMNVVGRSSLNLPVHCGTHRQLSAIAFPGSTRFQVPISFSGQRLTRQSRYYSLPSSRSKAVVVRAQQHNYGLFLPHSQDPLGAENFLDDIARYIYFKVRDVVAPHVRPDFHPFAWLPDGVHRFIHKSEIAAIVLLREAIHFGLFYFLFCKTDEFCKWLNWLYVTKTKGEQITKETYKASKFRAMAGPIRLLIVVWAVTRMCYIGAPVLKLNMKNHMTAKIRSVGIVVAGTWFCFQWKQLYVGTLALNNKADAHRIFAFDKVVSLLVYFAALNAIGEVTGFGLRSLLAVGGFSGLAIGLAAREIVSNFFGGAVLFTTRPFEIGDRIKTGQVSGYVQDIGFLQTKILSLERMPMVVPNQSFTNQVITNYSRANNKSVDAEFPLRTKDVFLVRHITNRILQYLRTHPDVDVRKSSPLCYLTSVKAMELHLAVKCVLRYSGGSDFYQAQQEIFLHIAEILDLEGAWIGNWIPQDSLMMVQDAS